jgi:transposase
MGSFIMEKYKRKSAEERWTIIEPIINKKKSVKAMSKNYNIHESVISGWVRKYKASGMNGLENGKCWKQYSMVLKKKAVEDVLMHGLSLMSVTAKYEISSHSVLSKWIRDHNSGKELEATSSGRMGTIMTEGRKTTFEERIEITQFCIARNKDYEATMMKYKVSYQQIYSWVRKYEKFGTDSLHDGRGRNKTPTELTESEMKDLRIKELETRNEFLEMREAFGKKLVELEQRYGHFR